VAYPGILFGGGGVQQIQLMTEGKENVYVWGGSPLVRCSAQFAIRFDFVKFSDVEGCYGCIFHGTGNSAQLCQNFGTTGGGGPLKHPKTNPSVTPIKAT
jgi:hypothetical protein